MASVADAKINVRVNTVDGPADVELEAGQSAVVCQEAGQMVEVTGPMELHVGEGHMAIVATIVKPKPRPFITGGECVRCLIEHGRDHERWSRYAADLRIRAEAADNVLDSEKLAAIQAMTAEQRANVVEALAECDDYLDALCIADAMHDALERAEAEAAAAREWIRVYVAVAGLLECGA